MAQSRATQAGLYAELGDAATLATQAGLYAELGGAGVLATQAGFYVEIVSARVLATQAGFYVELGRQGGITKESQVIFNGNVLPLRGWSLESAMRAADTTVLNDTAGEQIPIIPDWRFRCNGLWSTAIDDIFGAACASAQDADSSLAVYLGPAGGRTVYLSNTTFVASYRVDTTIDDVIVFEVSIGISGKPSRAVGV